MKGLLLISAKGSEKILQKVYGGKIHSVGRVKINCSLEKACEIVANSRIITRGVYFDVEGKIKTLKDVVDLASSSSLWEFVKGRKFAVRCSRFGIHDFTSLDVNREVGKIGVEAGGKVDLEDPEVMIRVDIADNKAIVGLDLVGERSLTDRGWKKISHHAGINGVLASLLIILSRWEKEIFVDPMCGNATIPVEAYHFALHLPITAFRKDLLLFNLLSILGEELKERKRSVDVPPIYGFDISEKSIREAKINARNANAKIRIEKRDLFTWREWITGEEIIVTNPPYGMRCGSEKYSRKIVEVLFEISDNVKGLVFISPYKFETSIELWNSNLKTYATFFGKSGL